MANCAVHTADVSTSNRRRHRRTAAASPSLAALTLVGCGGKPGNAVGQEPGYCSAAGAWYGGYRGPQRGICFRQNRAGHLTDVIGQAGRQRLTRRASAKHVQPGQVRTQCAW